MKISTLFLIFLISSISCLKPYNLDEFMKDLESRNPSQPQFIQATRDIISTIIDVVNSDPKYLENKILERITEPNIIHEFKVEWENDHHEIMVNKGYRVQFNNALGPYKGGLRFHKSVTLDNLKFLGFEQLFKNALTGLPMGSAKGGSDFDPKGKSDAEILRFCKSFMTSLYKYIGPEFDIPGGDIGVGRREIGYLFGQYKLLTQKHEGAFTGKGLNWGGSLLRPQTVGFGAVYLANEVLIAHGDDIKGKTIAISGYGLASIGVILKARQLGAKVVTISGPDGYIYDENGIDTDEKINFLKDLLNSYTYRIAPYAKKFGAKFIEEKKPWEVPVDMAFPCAFQNELDIKDAADLNRNGVRYVIETSNLGCTSDAVKYLIKNRITFVPSKAANAGGIALSGLEMAQNSMKLRWSTEEVDSQLKNIMSNIHNECLKEGRESDGYVNYAKGANIAGFKKVADAMIDLGW